ncbi:MAG: hypothetical protein ACRDGP_00355 [Actinomycetota bacterium]
MGVGRRVHVLHNVAKYPNASRAHKLLAAGEGELRFEVEDGGVGFDPNATANATELQGMADRLDAISRTLSVRSAPGRGTTIEGRVPTEDRGARG